MFTAIAALFVSRPATATATATAKLYNVHRPYIERGVFITQQRTAVVGTVKARSAEEANRLAKLAHGSDAYAELYLGD